MYHFYLDGLLLPVAPEKLTLEIRNRNKTMELIDGSEINLLKDAGLTEIKFRALLPAGSYPFAQYADGFLTPKVFLQKFEALKTGKKPFGFIVTRTRPDGAILYDTNLTVSLETYTVSEDAGEAFDIWVDFRLKQYRPYGTKLLRVVNGTVMAETKRETLRAPTPTTEQQYRVAAGDNLWGLARRFYGDGTKYAAIYLANQELIDTANAGKSVPKYTIYPGQTLRIPAEEGRRDGY